MLGYAGPLSGGKLTLFEGGTRAPWIVRWPGKVKAGYVDHSNVFCGVDWLPTICKLAGVKSPEDIDGEDVSDMWLGTKREHRKPLFWQKGICVTVRDKKWKYWSHQPEIGEQLFDITSDQAEKNNLIKAYPEVVAGLRDKVKAWGSELPQKQKKRKTEEKTEAKQKIR